MEGKKEHMLSYRLATIKYINIFSEIKPLIKFVKNNSEQRNIWFKSVRWQSVPISPGPSSGQSREADTAEHQSYLGKASFHVNSENFWTSPKSFYFWPFWEVFFCISRDFYLMTSEKLT